MLAALTFAQPCHAQDTDVLQSRALTAIRQASLVSPTLAAYRLEGTLTLFDGAGKNPQVGSFKVLRKGEDNEVSITFPNASSKFLHANAKRYSSVTGSLPFYAGPLLTVVQTPFVFRGFGNATPILPHGVISNSPLDCLATDATDLGSHGLKPPVREVCLEHASDSLRVVVNGDLEYSRDDIFDFGTQRPARYVRLRIGGILVGEAKIIQLEATSFGESVFTPTSDMKASQPPLANLSSAVMSGRILSHENPKYPKLARAAHLQGIVVMHAIIDTDGHISNLSVISSPDKSLTEASIKAVSKWTYEPYVLDGKPTAVDTTITVNFAIGK